VFRSASTVTLSGCTLVHGTGGAGGASLGNPGVAGAAADVF
jgi:hypothetical protein